MSAREWKHGDVALVVCNDGEERRAIYGGCGVWIFRDGTRRDTEVSKARPLVIIDFEDREQVERLMLAYESMAPSGLRVEEMQTALRSLIPPKPEEPTGLGAVVEDAEGADWHRTRSGRWIAGDGLRTRADGWGHIDAIKVLSEGVTP